MEERELTFFTSSNFPPGGYAVPDEHKNGAYFVQGRSQFFFFSARSRAPLRLARFRATSSRGDFSPVPRSSGVQCGGTPFSEP